MVVTIENELQKTSMASLFQWSDNVFPAEGKRYEWALAQKHIVAWHGKAPMAHLGIGDYIIKGVAAHQVIGVGKVVVRPEWQGRDIPRALFTRLHEQYAAHVHTLFCPDRLVGYYERHGYELYHGDFTVVQGDSWVGMPEFNFMYHGQIDLGSSIRVPGRPW